MGGSRADGAGKEPLGQQAGGGGGLAGWRRQKCDGCQADGRRATVGRGRPATDGHAGIYIDGQATPEILRETGAEYHERTVTVALLHCDC
jgi:hypothetical protein